MRNHLVDNERREVFAISEISINWDIRVKQKLSALAALGAAGSKWRQYWFCVTPVKSYVLIAEWSSGSSSGS